MNWNESSVGKGRLGWDFKSMLGARIHGIELGAKICGAEVGAKICGAELGTKICGAEVPNT